MPTKTWKHNADVAIANLVNENARVTIIVEGQQDIDMSLASDFRRGEDLARGLFDTGGGKTV
jgi:hypothetical protein